MPDNTLINLKELNYRETNIKKIRSDSFNMYCHLHKTNQTKINILLYNIDASDPYLLIVHMTIFCFTAGAILNGTVFNLYRFWVFYDIFLLF